MARHKYYAPEFRIEINNQPIPASLRAAIASVTWNNDAKAADKVELSIHDPNEFWFNNALLEPENDFALALGYAGNGLEQIFSGEITAQNATFQQGGGVSLRIEAMDKSHRLMRGSKERSFRLQPDSTIISLIAREYGLIPKVDAESAFAAALAEFLGHARRQANQSDFAFLNQIATEMGVQFDVEGNTLTLKKIVETAVALDADWGRTLISFNPRISTVGQIDAVSIKIWLRELSKNLAVTVGWDWKNERLKLDISPGGLRSGSGGNGHVLSLVNQPVRDPTDLLNVMNKALSELKSRLNNRIVGNGSLIGDTRIKIGALINLQGMGKTFSGRYRISSATHTLDSSGYKVNFQGNQEIVPDFMEL